ncbi:hypothetical protein [Salinarimonas ramus]|uniref:Uncharacterized protein n=1 Tax=Salinarimonas ramus TaxID=690164 RepID=A0A917V354_9HYPH|nr:hypothetical protein [Salinarimonas ramus]GGK28168.1 hypothetical protein GCM10011322_13350 [Salinarimonas ramus]
MRHLLTIGAAGIGGWWVANADLSDAVTTLAVGGVFVATMIWALMRDA